LIDILVDAKLPGDFGLVLEVVAEIDRPRALERDKPEVGENLSHSLVVSTPASWKAAKPFHKIWSILSVMRPESQSNFASGSDDASAFAAAGVRDARMTRAAWPLSTESEVYLLSGRAAHCCLPDPWSR
jgi:hypothetical protein